VTPPPPEREPPAKSPAVSLWHKIFGAPAEPPSTQAETTTTDVSQIDTTQEGFESQDIFHGSEIRSLSGEDVSAAEFVEERLESTLADDESETLEHKRGRSRRRRRGGRGRKSNGRQRERRSPEPGVHESGGDDQLDADFDDLEGDADEFLDRDQLDAPPPAAGESDREDSGLEQVQPHARSLSATQRAIPSWDDAIGFIVESNMQNRSQRRPPSRSDTHGGAARGRSRGRRK